LLRNQSTAHQNYPDYPQGFLQAVNRYTKDEFVFRSEIWELLQKWRQYVKRDPESTPWVLLSPPPPYADDREFVAYFKELILAAVFHGQEDILRALSETVRLAQAPEPAPDSDIESVRAVMKAFRELYKGGGEAHWPLKPEVRAAATDILKTAALPVPSSKRQWSRIFEKAGLAKLRQSRPKSKRA
jgi:hypothetical protein